jgi:hypothetical protein
MICIRTLKVSHIYVAILDVNIGIQQNFASSQTIYIFKWGKKKKDFGGFWIVGFWKKMDSQTQISILSSTR